jgi:hypothetical protein
MKGYHLRNLAEENGLRVVGYRDLPVGSYVAFFERVGVEHLFEVTTDRKALVEIDLSALAEVEITGTSGSGDAWKDDVRVLKWTIVPGSPRAGPSSQTPTEHREYRPGDASTWSLSCPPGRLTVRAEAEDGEVAAEPMTVEVLPGANSFELPIIR